VKEKMEEEVADVFNRKKEMEKMKVNIAKNHAEESKTLQEILSQ
jgi:hypothetical protein